MGRCYRKKVVDVEEEEEVTTAGPASLSERLQDTKLLQQRRKKDKGVSTEKLQSGNAALQTATGDDELAPEDGEMALGDTFANEELEADEDPNMVKYVEEELRKRRGLGEGELGPGERPGTELEELEKDLYSTPDNLKAGKPSEEDAADRWATGIEEVELPVEHRLRNIEATEQAKAALLNREPKRKRPDAAALPRGIANLSTNFNLHRKNFSKSNLGSAPGRTTTMQEHVARAPFVRAGPAGDRPAPRSHTATDDLVASRFRSRERQRFVRNR